MRMIFNFVCTECKHEFEALIDNKLYETECKKCGEKAERQISCPMPLSSPGTYNWDVRNKEQAQKLQREKGTTQRKPWT